MRHIWGRREIHTKFWWKNKLNRPLGRPMYRLEDNIHIDFNEIRWNNME
jgi:hypothetical protein